MIYVASRASVPKYPAEWRRLRSIGWPISSSWIDEAGPGETTSMTELWMRIESEVRAARGLVLWAEEEDFPLKGAFIEVGMALGMGKPVAVYTRCAFDNSNYRPFGSWMNHPLVQRCFSLASAMQHIMNWTPADGVQAVGTSSKPISSLTEFCAEAKRTGLTAATLAEALSKRPEFADCLPTHGVQGVAHAQR